MDSYLQGFESRWMSVELIYAISKQLLFFYKFSDFFFRRYSLMNRESCNNLFRLMQHDNFRNLNRLIFIHWKHFESRVDAFWYCFPVIKRYIFSLFDEIGSHSKKSELLWNIAILFLYGVIKVLWLDFLVILWSESNMN